MKRTETVRNIILVLSILLSGGVSAIDSLPFDNETQRLQYQRLTEELRCPKCQNQNIADSNSPIAKDLRNEVHRMIMQGESDAQIVEFMVERYGNFVMYKPKFDKSTYLLWLGPALIALIGFFIVVMTARKKRKAGRESGAELSREEVNVLNKILSEDEK